MTRIEKLVAALCVVSGLSAVAVAFMLPLDAPPHDKCVKQCAPWMLDRFEVRTLGVACLCVEPVRP